jgi:hypothetical protein
VPPVFVPAQELPELPELAELPEFPLTDDPPEVVDLQFTLGGLDPLDALVVLVTPHEPGDGIGGASTPGFDPV